MCERRAGVANLYYADTECSDKVFKLCSTLTQKVCSRSIVFVVKSFLLRFQINYTSKSDINYVKFPNSHHCRALVSKHSTMISATS